MANLSLREAVKLFDVSRPTLTKSLNSGKLSGVRDGKGHWSIDPAEVGRLYLPRRQEDHGDGKNEQGNLTASNSEFSTELERLRTALAVAETRADAAEKLALERAERIDDLRRLLPSPSQAEAGRQKTKSRWWPW